MTALVLLSGGMDSAVILAQVLKEADDAVCMCFSYGSKHGEREQRASAQIADWYGVPLLKVALPPDLFFRTNSALINPDRPIPAAAYGDGPQPTSVPFRNGIFLSIAASKAMEHGADTIYIGAHAEDWHQWAYPDCSPEFVGAMANAIYAGTYHQVRLAAPFNYMKKSDIVRTAIDLNAPLELTYSCYRGRDLQCGDCPTCLERIDAFRANWVIDPVGYETVPTWEGCVSWR